MIVTMGSKQFGQIKVSLKGMYVWGVNSTVTKHSDHFVWKDTSERVTRRCDDIVDRKRVNVFVLKYFFGGSWATKKSPKKTEMLSPTRFWCHVFNVSRLTPHQEKPRSARFSVTALRAVFINGLIRINPGQKILTSCFLHCQHDTYPYTRI